MKPVRIVGRPISSAHFFIPAPLHRQYAAVQRSTVVNHINQFGIYLARQIPEHLFLVEYILGEVFRRTFRGTATATGFFLNAVLLL